MLHRPVDQQQKMGEATKRTYCFFALDEDLMNVEQRFL
jgi:hypothetical protein